MKNLILIVEDESHIRDMIRFALLTTEFRMFEAENTQQAQRLIADRIPSLILLDWMLPGESGIEFMRILKKEKTTQEIPIIMLTAKAEEINKIKGLDAGADDYITKPFSPRELIARIRAVLRRGSLVTPEGLINMKDLCINVKEHQVKIGKQLLKLTKNEYRLLHFFVTHQDRVYDREHLLTHVWGGDVFVENRTVDALIRRLRRVLRKYNYHKFIHTVRGIGYKFSIKL
ncbi:MAG: transcriptional regulator PhoB [Coxiella sp. DG_40]|nr:MAG: transcriptional regulator PhoB [Coxiella sp. DG_40]